MAQINTVFQIVAMSGMNNSTFTAVTVPIRVRRLRIFNTDASNTILLATDTAGATLTIPVSSNFEVELMEGGSQLIESGQVLCYLKGAGAQPTLVFEG